MLVQRFPWQKTTGETLSGFSVLSCSKLMRPMGSSYHSDLGILSNAFSSTRAVDVCDVDFCILSFCWQVWKYTVHFHIRDAICHLFWSTVCGFQKATG